jgi:hypothetical protein
MIVPIEDQTGDDTTLGVNMDYAYLHLMIRSFRVSLFILNVIVIIASIYFAFTGRDLFGNKFETHQAIVIFIAICVEVIAFLGIVNALWCGKPKDHFKIAIGYALCISLMVAGALISCLLLSEFSGADILFIVLATFMFVLLVGISWSFALCIHREKMIAKMLKKRIKK